MRATPAALVLTTAMLALALGGASAQTPDDTPIRITTTGFDGLAKPLRADVRAPLSIDVACTLLAASPLAGTEIQLEPVRQPAWATLVLNPPSIVLTLDDCGDDHRARAEVEIIGAVTDMAPAHAPAPVVVAGFAETATGDEARGEVETTLAADYFPLLDVTAPSTNAKAAAGDTVDFGLLLANHGNGRVHVAWSVANASGAQVTPPDPLRLGSRQLGDASIAGEANLTVVMPEPARALLVELRWTSRHDMDGAPVGEEGTITFSIQPSSAAADALAETADRALPLPAAWPLVAVAIAALAASARRHV